MRRRTKRRLLVATVALLAWAFAVGLSINLSGVPISGLGAQMGGR